MVIQVMIFKIHLGNSDQFEVNMNAKLKNIAKEDIIKIEYLSNGQSFYIFYNDESMNL